MGDRRAPTGAAARTAEDLLQLAMAAKTPAARGRWARKGLSTRAPLDRTTQAMLLRQLSLSLYEAQRFEQARTVALQALDLGVLPDVVLQDAARAALATGDVDGAVSYLRVASRDKPLYKAHLALVRLAAGEALPDLQSTIDDLAAAPCGQGYGRFVLGHLAYAAGVYPAARRYLEAFVRRTEASRPVLALALAAELAMARSTLSRMAAN